MIQHTPSIVDPEEPMPTEATAAVLVCGAGITGIQASLDLADSGFKVYLVDSSPVIGGRMAQLDKTFPTGDCAMCTLSPKLVECARNKNIEIITLADVQGIAGEPGDFHVTIRKNPRFVDADKCNACGDCVEVCPVTLPSEFDCALGQRRAIFRAYPQAIPNVYGISKASGRAPCKSACPAGINVQGYVALIADGKFTEAYEVIREQCPLPAVCGRVCHHPCQDQCNRNEIDEAVAVRDLKRFAADYVHAHANEFEDLLPEPVAARAERVAIVGSGPAGLTVAHDLVRMGYGVTVFDSQARLGGMLRYGIPAYRLDDEVLDREIGYIEALGVQMRPGKKVEDPVALLKSDDDEAPGGIFDAVFVGVGAWTSRALDIKGEDAPQVLPGLGFLHEVNNGRTPEIGPDVVVIGGGDVAMDAGRCALRLEGVENVHVACLESAEEMPAHDWEAAEALEEGVVFHNSVGPTRIETDGGKVMGVAFRTCTSVFDADGRFAPEFDDAQTMHLKADTVIVTIGQGVDAESTGSLDTGPGGRIVTDENTLATSVSGVFAGGDAVLGPASLVDAMAHGHRAAKAINAWLRGTTIDTPNQADRDEAQEALAENPRPDAPKQNAQPMPQAPAAERTGDFREIDLGYTAEQAVAEAKRCLACGLCSECGQCVKACEAGAIDHDMTAVDEVLDVGSVILAPGFDAFNASERGEFGYGRYDNVVTSLQFERMLSASGPTNGQVIRPSDGKHVESIAFIQCVGSRDAARGNGYCSSICCTAAAKEAMVALEHAGNAKISVFCMDIRAFGKEFDQYVDRARDEHGVEFVRAIPSRVVQMPGSRNGRVRTFDTDGTERLREFDLVVLSVGLRPSASVVEMASALGVELNAFGFCQTDRLSPMASSRPGIYVAGVCQEPKDIPESVAQGSGAAARAMEQLADVRGSLITKHEYPWERDVTDEEPRIGVFICHCGHNIASVIDVEDVARQAAEMPNVVHAEASLYTCSDNNQERIKSITAEKRLNRLVVASCTPRTHEPLFQETLRESGLNQYLFAMTNIRDQCSWVHRDDPVAATAKAVDLMRMAVGRARRLRPLETGRSPVDQAGLIVGGGLAGMTAALALADQGFDVHLVEKEGQLGGNLRHIHATLERPDVQDYLARLIARVREHPRITVYLNATLQEFSGHVGHFSSRIQCGGEEITVGHGAVIIAIGGQERQTDLYLNGQHDRVTTQRQLEAALAQDGLEAIIGGRRTGIRQSSSLSDEVIGTGVPPAPDARTASPDNPTIVMIQCVGSRNEENPYCSRVCCSEAVKNALEIKKRKPGARVVVLGKDIRTYGFRETYFQQAREAGVIFIRHPQTDDPQVTDEAGKLVVRVKDGGTGRDLTLHPNLLVLSTGIAPAADNPVLSGMFRTALTADGFFLEAHPKLRPVDLANEGEFICGLSHSPRFIDETIAQARAAAGRAATILSKAYLTIPGQVARVDTTDCIACATCVKVCPYGAPRINEIGKAEIQGATCMGCGSCAASCPARAITLQHQEDQQFDAMIDELLVSGETG